MLSIKNALSESADALAALQSNDDALRNIEDAASVLAKSLQSGGQVFSFGNGGSMCDAMHFAEELSGRFRDDRLALPAAAISDPGHMSCVANDFGYQQVFSRYIEAHCKPGDVAVGISTSGSSENVILAIKAAKQRGARTIVLTGHKDSALVKLADIAIVTPAGRYADRVQELHIKVVHILIECIERQIFPQNYE